MFEQEMWTTWGRVAAILLSSAAMLVGVIVYTRIVGLRTFAKMSSFDFTVTVATGSLVAGTALSSSSLVDGLVAVASLFALQFVIALLRSRVGGGAVVDNTPLLLMRDGEMLRGNMRLGRVTADDVRAKLREANVRDLCEVHAVVLETTGDVSVLHGGERVDDEMLRGVRT